MPAKKRPTTAPRSAAKPAPPRAEIGILGGTGLYDIDGIKNLREVKLKTPLGDPSDAYIVGTLEGRRVAFLSRHGRGHRHLPSEINYRANVYGFKMLGVTSVISVSSVGSLREEIRPCDFVFADQFIDKTHRRSTFFGEGHRGPRRPGRARLRRPGPPPAPGGRRPGAPLPRRRHLRLHGRAGLLDQGRVRDAPPVGRRRSSA